MSKDWKLSGKLVGKAGTIILKPKIEGTGGIEIVSVISTFCT